MDLLNDFDEEKICIYKNEKYSVRDNGAVCRHSRVDKKKRLLDDKWTFGRIGPHGYLYIAGIQVHRIVATAFYGESPKPDMVVDHKDTNKQNNRSENLRWVTKEENILNNPNTIQKIEYITGRKIDEVLKNPSILHEASKNKQNTAWMRPVNKEEAKNFQERQKYWLSDSDYKHSNGTMGEWIFSSYDHKNETVEKIIKDIKNTVKPNDSLSNRNKELSIGSDDFSNKAEAISESDYFCDSLNENAKQNWSIPTKFLCCPKPDEEQSLNQYINNLKNGTMFSANKYYTVRMDSYTFHEERQVIIVKSSRTDTNAPLGLLEISYRDNKFFHMDTGSLTLNTTQDWKTPTEFLCCPKTDEEQSLQQYIKNLKIGKMFSKNIYGSAQIINFFHDFKKNTIIVELQVKAAIIEHYKLMEITYENKVFFHDTVGSYHDKRGGDKYFTLAIGKEWKGGDVFDDFC